MRTVSRHRILALLVLASACSGSTDAGGDIDHIELTLHPLRTSYPINDSLQVAVTPFSKQGTWVPAAPATLRSLTPDIATVDRNGLVRGRSRGTATIEVEMNGKTARIDIPFRGILHRGYLLDLSETWLVADTPHVVELVLDVGRLTGGDTVALTIEAGSTVRFRPGAGLIFGAVAPAALLIPPGDPVIMDEDPPAGASPSWRGLLFDKGRFELRNLTMRHCGMDYQFDNPGACIIAAGGSLLIDSVTISEGRNGLSLGFDVQLAAGSRKLSVVNTRGYPATIPPHLLGPFPRGGRFSGNGSDEIVVTNGRVLDSADWSGLPAPVRITGGVSFEGPANPVLTLPPGSDLHFERGGGLSFATGGILAGALGGAPVVLESTGDGWLGMAIEHAGGSALRNVVLQDCGVSQTVPGPSRFDACLIFGPQGGSDSGLIVQDVVVRGSRTAGIYIAGGGTFHPDSRNLTVRQSTSYPLQLWGPAAVAIPSGDYRFNDVNAIWIIGGLPDGARLRDVGVPYRFPDGLEIASTLFIDPGVTIEMGVGTFLNTGFGNFVAVGTAAKPITFRSTTPGIPGSWYGIQMGVPTPGPGTRFDYVVIADAGAGTGGATGAVWLHSDPGGLFRNTTFVRSAGCGIVMYDGSPWTDDYADPVFGNTFVDVAGPTLCTYP